MEVDEIHTQVCKFQRISCNGSSSGGGDGGGDNSSNPRKLADTRFKNHLFPVVAGGDNTLNPNESADTHNKNHLLPADGGDNSSNPSKSAHTHNKNHLFPVGGGGGGWPSSRIVRVSRTSGGKDRHSKVVTSKGLRDRRIRLSVTTAVEFYDLQDRLGYDQPSKAVEWLINAAATSISELPSLDPSFSGDHHHHNRHQLNRDDNNNNNNNNNNNHSNVSVSKSSACSSTSETSKGSGNSRSENRIRARERARDMVAKRGTPSQNSSFTDLLTGGGATTPMDYFQMPQFNISAGDNPPQHHRFCFQENFTPVVTGGGGGGGGEGYQNLSFSIIPPPPPSSASLSSSSLSLSSDMNRGTLQSNLLSSLPHHLQRFQQSSMVNASTSANFPLFMAPTIAAGAPDHFPATVYDSHRLQLYSDHYKETSKN